MGFFRRLFGAGQPLPGKDKTDAKTVDTKPVESKPANAPHPEPQVSAPGAVVNTAAPEPIIQDLVNAETPIAVPRPPTTDVLAPLGVTRRLDEEEITASSPNKHLVFGINSDVGAVRTNNQDSLYAFFSTQVSTSGTPDFGLFVVADGMGGHLEGERASALATKVIAEYILKEFYLSLVSVKEGVERPIIGDVLVGALQKANDIVSDEIPDGGTTVTAAAIVGEWAYFAHVGDSRAYLLSRDGLDQITRDHSLVQRLIELDHITPEEAPFHPQRNVLYRAIGQNDQIEIDTATRRLPAGSRILLCSDGLWNQVPEDLLVTVVKNTATPQDACDKLVAMANERGGNDNVTVILVQLPG